ncbi:hypothetical protein BVRB_037410, partial [Beta vulgaris subsp. vulgaris]
GAPYTDDSSQPFSPSLKGDIYEKDDMYMLRLEVPGVHKDNIKIYLTDVNLLKVVVNFKGNEQASSAAEAKKKRENNIEENRTIWSDRHYGTVTFQQRLPPNLDLEKIEVTSKNGMLYFKLPKKATSTPKPIKIH